MNSIEEKEQTLLAEIKSYGALAVTYSGGVDSTYLATAPIKSLATMP